MSVDGWREVKLGDICNIVMGQSPKGEFCNNIGKGIPLLNGPTEFGNFHPNAIQFTTDVKKQSEKDDLLFCVRGSTTGRMNWSNKEYALGRGLATIRHKMGVDYKYFVKGLIDFKLEEILNSATGSTFPNVGKDLLNSLPIYIPSLPEQKAIADTLSCLDDKIELNNRINKTLEEMAQAIFKSWFVDFEPFRNDEFEDSELGRIPSGWRVGTLGEIITLNYGKSLTAKNRIDGNIRVYSSAGITGFHNQALINESSIIVGRKGSIGTVYYSTEPSFCIDTAYYATQKDSRFPLLLMYQLLKELKLNQYNEDSAVPGLNRNTVYAINIIIPPESILKQCSETFTSIYSLIFDNLNQIQTLTTIRDALLPKLMSGEIRVSLEN